MKLRRRCTSCGKLLTERDRAVKLPHTGKFFCDWNHYKTWKTLLSSTERAALERELSSAQLTLPLEVAPTAS